MNDKQKQLIEKVGGLDVAQRIVQRAPDTSAIHYKSGNYYRVEEKNKLRHFHKHTGECVQGCSGEGWSKYTNGTLDDSYIAISDIRAAIVAQREFDLCLAPDDAYAEFPNCKGFSQGVRMGEGYCGDCGGHSTDPIHAPKTKYDWSNVPEHIAVITTDMDGKVWLWEDDTTPSDLVCADTVWGMTNEAYWDEDRSICSVSPEHLKIALPAFSGDWRDSLEPRPATLKGASNV